MYQEKQISGKDITMFKEDLQDEFGHDMYNTYMPLILIEMGYSSIGEAMINNKEDSVRETLRSRVSRHRELFRRVN